MNIACSHLAALPARVPGGDGCEVCLAEGGTWVHLRQCLECSRTLCCDSSPSQHMSRHAEATGHAAMRSLEPGEDWTWCYADDSMVREVDGGWRTCDLFTDTGLEYVGRHLEAGGALDGDADAATLDGFPMGSWIDYVRGQRASGTLDPRDAEAIEGLRGWTW